MKKSAFTLIELLVVISIIAILAGIALPVFQKVQEKGRATQDASNLRQLGLSLVGYMNDNSDTLPSIAGTNIWTTKLNPNYVAVWKVFQSPFDKRTPLEDKVNAPVSYGLNLNLDLKSSSDIISPSNCVLLAPAITNEPISNLNPFGGTASKPGTGIDKSSNVGTGAGGTLTGGTHAGGKRINVLFADSHVAEMIMSDFHTALANPDTTSAIKDTRWNK